MDATTVSCVYWVPRGCALRCPESYVLSSQEISTIKSIGQMKMENRRTATLKPSDKQSNKQAVSQADKAKKSSEEKSIDMDIVGEQDSDELGVDDGDDDEDTGGNDEANLDDDDDDDVPGSQFFTVLDTHGLNCVKDLSLDDIEAEEQKDNQIYDTDMPLLCASAQEDASTLEVYIFDDNTGAFYVHHDIIIESFPLSMCRFSTLPNMDTHNFVALGTFSPYIDIWNLDVLDQLEPVVRLGENPSNSPKSIRKESKKSKSLKVSTKPPNSHTGPIMSLDSHPTRCELLLSGSADETIKIWNISSAQCVHTYTHHTDKVQCCKFNPNDETVILSASFDQTAAVSDIRYPLNPLTCCLPGDAESIEWMKKSPSLFMVSCEGGKLCAFDVRMLSSDKLTSTPLWSISAHSGNLTAARVSSAIPELMVTCGMDEHAKVWRLNDATFPELVFEKNLQAGPLYCCSANPDVGSLFGFGGNCAVVWDVASEEVVAKKFELDGDDEDDSGQTVE